MPAEETDTERPIPAIKLNNGLLAIGEEQLEAIQFSMLPYENGDTLLSFSALHHGKPWLIEATMASDASLLITTLQIDMQAKALNAAILDLLPLAVNGEAFSQQLPENLTITGENLSLTANGRIEAALKLTPQNTWRGLKQIAVSLNHTENDLAAEAHLQHSLGSSTLRLQGNALGHELSIEGAPLPVAEAFAADWPLATFPAPQAVDLAGSALRRNSTGNIKGALRLAFPGKWHGLQRVNIDQISLENPLRYLVANEQRKGSLRLVLDTGHQHPLSLYLSASEEQGVERSDVQRSLRLRGHEAPVSSATLMTFAEKFGRMSPLPALAQRMLPPLLSLSKTDITTDSATIDGHFSMEWAGGFLRSDVATSLAKLDQADLGNIALSHSFIGQFNGNVALSSKQISIDWNQLIPAQSSLLALTLYANLPANSAQAISETLAIVPLGEATFGRHNPRGQASLKLYDANHAHLLQAQITADKLAVSAERFPLSLVTTLYPSLSLEGQITAMSADLDLSGNRILPQKATLTTTPVSGSSGEWTGSSNGVTMNAVFSQDNSGNITPESATITFDQLNGSHRGYLASIPGLQLKLTRQGEQRWLKKIRIPNVEGHLSAALSSSKWATALPESGEFSAHAFDVAAALRSLSLRDSDGTACSLRIPQELTTQLDGKLRASENEQGYILQLDEGKLSKLTWLPWVSDAEMTLKGSSLFGDNAISSKLSGAVVQGQFNILGHLTDIRAEDLVYGLALRQNRDGLVVDDLFFAVKPPSNAETKTETKERETRAPLMHLSGKSDNNGVSELQAVIDEIDIGWVTSLPDIGIPKKLKITGRARSVLDLRFDGANTLETSGMIFPIGVNVDLSSGRLQITNMSGTVKILPRRWLLRNGSIQPLTTEDKEPTVDEETTP